MEDLVAVGRGLNPEIENFDASCFDGVYCTGADLWLISGRMHDIKTKTVVRQSSILLTD